MHIRPARHGRAMAILRVLPVLALLAGLVSWSVDAYRVRQVDARIYQAAGAALARGDLLTAQSLYAQAGDYDDAPRHAAELDEKITPYLEKYQDGVAALNAGDFDTALALLTEVDTVLPGYGELDALLAQARAGQIAQLRTDARRAYAAQNWLLAEQLFTQLGVLFPDDAEIAATLHDLHRDHALFVFTQHGVLMRAVPGSAATATPVIDALAASWPVWSPDRTKIAFISPGDANNGNARGLYIVDPDGKNLRRLADFPAQYQAPVWSPDGARIAFTVDRVTAQHPSTRPSVIVLDIATGQATDIADPALPNASSPAWSPTGDRIAFVSRAIEHLQADSSVPDEILRVDRSSVYVYNFASEQTLNVGGDALPEPYRIAWSPSADQLLVFSRKDGASFHKGKLYLADIQTNAVTLIDGSFVNISMPVWSPDGSRFAYVIGTNIVRIASLGGKARSVNSSVDLAGWLTWSPSGDRLLAGGNAGSGEAALVDSGKAEDPVTAIPLVYDAEGGDAGPPDWTGVRGNPVTAPAASSAQAIASATAAQNAGD